MEANDVPERLATDAVLKLPPSPASVPAARLFVRARLAGHLEAVADAAESCVSELTTNAVLHAGTEVEIRVEDLGERVRIGVRDLSPVRPRHIVHTRRSATGRGMEMVSILAESWGVEIDADGGKVVWCELAASGPTDPDPDALLDAWSEDDLRAADEGEADGADVDGAAGAASVVLLGYPVRRGIRAREHTDALARECMLLHLDPGKAALSAAAGRLLEISAKLSEHYATELAEPERRKMAAFAAGAQRVDLHYPVLPETLAVVQAWAGVLAELDAFAEQDVLLTLCTPPDIAELTAWVLEEFDRQIAGAPPRPWTGALD